ncbi:MAG TPA: pyruvate, water dikinase regulatory protein [Deltaproteobacteria bacterium]|nr:pyruvate, water dikinase regulatory protein [Deltaproteobacteria bacterium]
MANTAHLIYIVSGGAGTSGEQVVNTVLAQFPDNDVSVAIEGNIRLVSQIEKVVNEARECNGIIVHTLVDSMLRNTLLRLTREQGVIEVDLMGPLIERLSAMLGRAPLGRPGLYRELRKEYFDRVSAMDFAMSHDDGQSPEDWPKADVLIIGVSRTGKTPLCVYLSVLGLKAANCPIIAGVPMPEELYQMEQSRVVGLSIDPDRLLAIRSRRMKHIGSTAKTGYTDPGVIDEDMAEARRVFSKGGFFVVNMTERTIEAGADEIIKRVGRI